MLLNDEEKDIVAGKCGPVARQALQHQIKVGDFFSARDFVPVTQAQRMRAKLAEFHPDFAYREKPGAGHWWGNDAVDWPELFAFFERRQRAPVSAVRTVRFYTASPGVSSTADWLTVEMQAEPFRRSYVELALDPSARRANLLLSGIQLADTRERVLQIGNCRIRIWGETKPCEVMEALKPGLRQVMEANWGGGAYGEVLDDGDIQVGDPARWVD